MIRRDYASHNHPDTRRHGVAIRVRAAWDEFREMCVSTLRDPEDTVGIEGPSSRERNPGEDEDWGVELWPPQSTYRWSFRLAEENENVT